MSSVLFKSVKAGFLPSCSTMTCSMKISSFLVASVPFTSTEYFPSPITSLHPSVSPEEYRCLRGELDILQELPLDSGPRRTSSSVARPLPLQSSQDALLVLLRMSARPLVLPVAGQDDVVGLDALVDEGSRGVTRDLSIGIQTIAENTRKVPTIF